jgi:hypothetical protein
MVSSQAENIRKKSCSFQAISSLLQVAYHVAVRARAGAARREELAARTPGSQPAQFAFPNVMLVETTGSGKLDASVQGASVSAERAEPT